MGLIVACSLLVMERLTKPMHSRKMALVCVSAHCVVLMETVMSDSNPTPYLPQPGQGEQGSAAHRRDWYEDFSVGLEMLHHQGRTITDGTDDLFCAITGNFHPLHIDHNFAAQTRPDGKPVVVGMLVVAISLGQSMSDVSLGCVVALGFDKIRFKAPVHHGDTIYSSSKVSSMRISDSKPQFGVVEVETTVRNQRGEVVCTYLRQVQMRRRDYKPDEALAS